MSLKSILEKIGLGAAGVGSVAASVALPGSGALLGPITNAIAAKLDPAVKNQFDLAVDAAKLEILKETDAHDAQVESTFTARIQAVAATMQAEANSQHWPEYSWRPFVGFAFGVQMMALGLAFSYLIFRVASGQGLPENALMQLSQLMGAMGVQFAAEGAVLGVQVWHAGQVDRISAKDGN